MNRFSAFARRLAFGLFAAVFAVVTPSAVAQSAASGTIEGRVLNARNGEYLENARLTVEGTSLETFTDTDGSYRLSNVPAGTVKVRVFYTGFPVQSADVAVAPGQRIEHDINLSATSLKPARSEERRVGKEC